MQTNILLLGEITTELKTLLKENSFPFSDDKTLDNYSAIIVRGGIKVDQDLIDINSGLKLIISAGIGVDNIDIEHARSRGIIVANCPFANAISTAEHSLALMLASIKKINNADRQLKEGTWDRSSNITQQFWGKTVGVIGLGRIGSHVASLYRAVGFNVVGYDPYIHQYQFDTRKISRVENLEDIFKHSNYISLHVSKTPETKDLVKLKHLKLLKSPNGIVNTCRGGIVDEKLILEFLESGDLDFYAADVFDTEPNPMAELVRHPNVIASPHIAANTVEAQHQVALDVILQLNQYFKENTNPNYSING